VIKENGWRGGFAVNISSRARRYRGAAFVIALLVLAVEATWFYWRNDYRAEARIEVGEFASFAMDSVPKFEEVESVGDIERFYANPIVAGSEHSFRSNCTLVGKVTPSPVVDVSCESESTGVAKSRLLLFIQPLLDRHQRLFMLQEAVYLRAQGEYREDLSVLESRIKSLRHNFKAPGLVALLVEDRLYSLEEKKKNIINNQKADEFRHRYHHMTRIDKSGIRIVNRKVGVKHWIAAILVALATGALAALLLGLGNIMANREEDSNA